jgi:hypothetical protein
MASQGGHAGFVFGHSLALVLTFDVNPQGHKLSICLDSNPEIVA